MSSTESNSLYTRFYVFFKKSIKRSGAPKLNEKLFSFKQNSNNTNINSTDLVNLFNKFFLGLLIITPAVAITGIVSKAALLIVTNIALALAHLIDLAFKVYRKEISIFEVALIVLGVAALVALILFCMPPFSIASGLFTVLFYANVFATAINLTVTIKDVFVSLIKEFIEGAHNRLKKIEFLANSFPKYFGKDIKLFFVHSELDERKNAIIIHHLKNTHGFKDSSHINKFLRKLYESSYKKQYSFLGFIRNIQEIKQLNTNIYDISRRGDAERAIKDLKKKRGRKQSCVEMAEECRVVAAYKAFDGVVVPYSAEYSKEHICKNIEEYIPTFNAAFDLIPGRALTPEQYLDCNEQLNFYIGDAQKKINKLDDTILAGLREKPPEKSSHRP